MNVPTITTIQSATIIDSSIALNRRFSDLIMITRSDHLPLSAAICCRVKRVQKKKTTKISTDEKRKPFEIFRGYECNRLE